MWISPYGIKTFYAFKKVNFSIILNILLEGDVKNLALLLGFLMWSIYKGLGSNEKRLFREYRKKSEYH